MDAFDEIIGYDSLKAELRRYCDVIKNTDRYLKIGVKFPRGILLYGDPGIGKTLMATSFIKEAGVKSYFIQKTGTEADICERMKETFLEAQKDKKSIILLDDIDKFSNCDGEHSNTDAYVAIQSCIDSVKDNNVFVLATANEVFELPRSLRRPGRFDHCIEMIEPKGEDRVKLVKHFIEGYSNIGNIDYEEISKLLDGKSTAVLENVMKEAGIYAGHNGKLMIEHSDIIRACLRTFYDAPEAVNNTPKDKSKTATHEAGHTVVSEILQRDSINLVSIQSYEGSTKGFVSYNKTDNPYNSEKAMKDEVCCLLAGKAAVEIQYGINDFGASQDIDRAHWILKRCGQEFAYFGFDKMDQESRDSSEKLEIAVAQEMETQYKRAKEILADYIGFLNDVTVELLAKEKLDKYSIQRIKHDGGYY